ncbi:MAG: hypothetical protein WC629_01330 [Candidatus Paceibacterota bacterium]|jgi:hypothetical protein
MTQKKDAKTWVKIIFFTVLVLVVLGYSCFQARKIVEGPKLDITSLKTGAVLKEPLVEIAGVAYNIKEISLDDRTIYIDEQGNFNEKLLLFPGYNIIRLKAGDKFGKVTNKTLEVTYVQ